MNHCEWIVRLRPEGNRPPAFRIVLADSQGRLQRPETPAVAARAFEDFVWGYGTAETRFRLAPDTPLEPVCLHAAHWPESLISRRTLEIHIP